MSIIFDGFRVKNYIDYIVFINEDGVNIEIPIEKVAADRIQKYVQRILPTTPCEPIISIVQYCDVCKQLFRDGDIIMQTFRSISRCGKPVRGGRMVDVHEDCEKNYQELLKQTVPLKDVLNK
jgi:hypothetical protein